MVSSVVLANWSWLGGVNPPHWSWSWGGFKPPTDAVRPPPPAAPLPPSPPHPRPPHRPPVTPHSSLTPPSPHQATSGRHRTLLTRCPPTQPARRVSIGATHRIHWNDLYIKQRALALFPLALRCRLVFEFADFFFPQVHHVCECHCCLATLASECHARAVYFQDYVCACGVFSRSQTHTCFRHVILVHTRYGSEDRHGSL